MMITDLANYFAAIDATFKGKPLIIQFTSSRCPPCVEIVPFFKS